MKFRPMLDALEAREVPSVVTPDEPTTPQPYTPPSNPGTPPGDTGTEPAKPADKPMDEKVVPLTQDQISAEANALMERAKEIEQMKDDLKFQLKSIKGAKDVIDVSVTVAKGQVEEATKTYTTALNTFEVFVKLNPLWKDDPGLKKKGLELGNAYTSAFEELDGKRQAYRLLLGYQSNLQQRVDAINKGLANLDAELGAIDNRLGQLLRAFKQDKPVYAIDPIPKAEIPFIDDAFKDWKKPLADPNLKAPVPAPEQDK